MIRFYEWLAGRLLLRSARARARRDDPQDAHELRHIVAAVAAGNSDGCDGGRLCVLDAAGENESSEASMTGDDDFTVTGDELDRCLDRAEAAETENERLREAMEAASASIRNTRFGVAHRLLYEALRNDALSEEQA